MWVSVLLMRPAHWSPSVAVQVHINIFILFARLGFEVQSYSTQLCLLVGTFTCKKPLSHYHAPTCTCTCTGVIDDPCHVDN